MNRYVQVGSVASRVIDGSAVLIRPDLAHVKGLNATGTCVWVFLATSRTVEEVAAELVRKFEIDTETALRDARVFVDELLAKGLIAAT